MMSLASIFKAYTDTKRPFQNYALGQSLSEIDIQVTQVIDTDVKPHAGAAAISNSISMGRSLNGLSAVYLEKQQYERAIACGQTAIAVLENTVALEVYALAAYQLGVSHLELHNFSEAEDYLNQALSLYMTLADSVNEDHVVLHLGYLYAQNQEYMYALAAYESVIDSLLERPLHEGSTELLADVLDLMVQLAEQSNQEDIAAIPYQRVLEQYVQVESPQVIAPFFHQLAKFYESLERYGLAATCYTLASQNG
ncbi:MAG: tetratricopeptide repeat protein [Cyanobacteria bacterium J06639_14]